MFSAPAIRLSFAASAAAMPRSRHSPRRTFQLKRRAGPARWRPWKRPDLHETGGTKELNAKAVRKARTVTRHYEFLHAKKLARLEAIARQR
jgi:hypothetical protein